MLNIDNKEVQIGGKINLDGFTNLDDIVKGDIQYAFPSYGDSKITFKKTGAEIKAFLMVKKAELETKTKLYETKATVLLASLKESGHEPSEPEGMYGDDDSAYFTFTYKEREDANGDTKKQMGMYNALAYRMKSVERDLKFMDTMIENLDDKKTYPLTPSQLTTLSKAEMSDTINKAMSSESRKVSKVMGEYEAGTLKTSAGKKVTTHDQAVAIAMSEAGISKSLKANEIKKYFPPAYHDYFKKADDDKADDKTNSKEYKAHFAKKLKEHGYASVGDIKGDKAKKKFFDDVDKTYTSKDEKMQKAFKSLSLEEDEG